MVKEAPLPLGGSNMISEVISLAFWRITSQQTGILWSTGTGITASDSMKFTRIYFGVRTPLFLCPAYLSV